MRVCARGQVGVGGCLLSRGAGCGDRMIPPKGSARAVETDISPAESCVAQLWCAGVLIGDWV